MKAIVFASAIVVAACATANAAEFVSPPGIQKPALVITTPDGWTAKPSADGWHLVVTAPDRSIAFRLTTDNKYSTYDKYAAMQAKAAGGTVPVKGESVTISYYPGIVYTFQVKGQPVRMIVLQETASRFAACAMVPAPGISDAQKAAAEEAMASLKVIDH
jgi:hypothetical protein